MKCDAKVVNRIKRLIGQLNGTLQMIEDERDCKEIITQLSASKSNIEKTMALIATNNLMNKLLELDEIDLEKYHEEVDLIIKYK